MIYFHPFPIGRAPEPFTVFRQAPDGTWFFSHTRQLGNRDSACPYNGRTFHAINGQVHYLPPLRGEEANVHHIYGG